MKQALTTRILKNNEDGMTLIEMLIVIALIAMVGTFLATNLIGKFTRAKVDLTKSQMRALGQPLELFKRDCGFYPLTDQGLDALSKKPTGGRECKNYDPEGYVKGKKQLEDGWGNPFMYESDGSKYALKSFGADAKEGGEGVDADISSDQLDQ